MGSSQEEGEEVLPWIARAWMLPATQRAAGHHHWSTAGFPGLSPAVVKGCHSSWERLEVGLSYGSFCCI